MSQWWKKLNSPMKIAIVCGLFSVVVAVCGFLGSIIINWPILSSFKINAERGKLKQWEITKTEISEPTILYANNTENKYFIISSSCWMTDTGGGVAKINGEEFATAELYFEILARQEKVLINDITIILDSYSPSVNVNNLTGFTIKLGQFLDIGVGGVDLGGLDIFYDPNITRFHLSNSRSIEIPEQEALGFTVLVSFHQPGEYALHLEILGTDFWSNQEKLNSDIVTLNWINYPDLRNVSFKDPVYSREIKLEVCQ